MSAELWNDWQRDRELMKDALEAASRRGEEYARAEAAYQAKKHAVAMQLEMEGTPVTQIQTVIKGDPDVNELLYQRIAAEARYRSAMKAVDVYRDDCRMVYDQLKRELSGDSSQY